MPTKQPCVYILASQRHGTLFTGATADLINRVHQHRTDVAESFTQRYGVHTLVWYEIHADILSAIQREKQLKKWRQIEKIRLIETQNPEWRDLWPALTTVSRSNHTDLSV